MTFPATRCTKCGKPINQDWGWCQPCRVLLKMPGTVHEKCLTCDNPVKPGVEFCAGCMKAKRKANGEYLIECLNSGRYYYQHKGS